LSKVQKTAIVLALQATFARHLSGTVDRQSKHGPGIGFAQSMTWAHGALALLITLVTGVAMHVQSLQDLLVDQLKDLYSAENQILKVLPKMAAHAGSPDLRSGFEEHLEQTKGHVERLEQIFSELGVNPKGKRCKALEGLVDEGKETMEHAEQPVLDAGLIAAAQKVEHYEIACYGCARTWAEQLGQQHFAELLQQTLDEERQTDEKLTALAQQGINQEAEAAEEKAEAVAPSRRRS
jgi:ferritin-like metal-binding protein YciE